MVRNLDIWLVRGFHLYFNCSLVPKSCPILLQSHGLCPPGFSVHGISQARILQWVAVSFSRGSSWPRDQTPVSCVSRWILYHWATREALVFPIPLPYIWHTSTGWITYVCACVLGLRHMFLLSTTVQWSGLACLSLSGYQKQRKCIKRKGFLNLRKGISTTPYERGLVSWLQPINIQWNLLWLLIRGKQWFYCFYLNIGYT